MSGFLLFVGARRAVPLPNARLFFLFQYTPGLRGCLADRFARDGDAACPDQLLDAQRLEQVDARLDLPDVSGDLDRIGGRRRIHHLATEDVGDAQGFGAVLLPRVDLDQRRFALDEFALVQVHYLDDVDDLVELLDDLLDDLVVAPCYDRHHGHARVQRRRHGQGLDIVAAPAEQVGHTR